MAKNDGGAVPPKLNDDKNFCELYQLQYWEDVTHIYDVGDDGEPLFETEHTDGDFRCYFCGNCEQEFSNFKQAKEHLNES